MMKMKFASAPGKVIFFGEHAVVYPNPGFPAYENLIDFLRCVPKPVPLLEKNETSRR